jgi:TubC N-terminal docking domain
MSDAVAALLSEFHRRGIVLREEGDQLRYRAPAGTLTSEDIATLRQHKAELLAMLAAVSMPVSLVPKPVPLPQRTDTSASDTPAWRCFICRGDDEWRSRWGLIRCRRCHPPAPGAEAVDP